MSKVECKGEDDEDENNVFAYKRSHIHQDQLIDSKRLHPTLEDTCSTPDTTTSALRPLFFLNEEKCRYVSVGFYVADN